ncbi:MAG: NAD(P)H-binding protein [Candidatus Puniceispirillales bacterium]
MTIHMGRQYKRVRTHIMNINDGIYESNASVDKKKQSSMVGGKKSFNDYEAADKQVREQSIVPSILVRPYALNDKAATGEYKILKPKTIHFAKPISRADLATCLVSITENNNFLNKTIHVVG